MTENGNTPQVPVAPQYVAPAPVMPEVWATSGEPTVKGGELVRVEVHSPAGRFVHFLEPDTAVTIGEQIADQGRKSAVAKHIIVRGEGK